MASHTFREVMNDLKAAGTAQNRKVYARHGVGEKMFGVGVAHLDKLQKRIKVNHKLARQLWASGNHDARMLASRIADPALLTTADLDAWVKDLDNYLLAGAFAAIVAQSPLAQKKLEKWTKAKKEFVSQAGWDVLCALAMRPANLSDDLSDGYLEEYIREIETGIHAAKNRVKHAMNMALISIGVRNDVLRKLALAAATRIGTVVVDHGETNCRTPDAREFIHRAVQHRRRTAPQPQREPATFGVVEGTP